MKKTPKLKSYRPLITENFIWDFPSRLNLKTISEFLNEDIDPTTEYISNTAKVTMQNTGVYWFIQQKNTDKICASVSLSDPDFTKQTAALMVTFKDLTDTQKDEIAQRLLVLLKDQLDLKEIEINELDHIIQEKFTNNGYTIFNKKTLKRS